MCLRYDITIYVPRTLQTLALNISTPTQITFSPQGHVELEHLSVILTSTHPRTKIDASEALHARQMELAILSGKLDGAVSIGDSVSLKTRRGQITLDVIPNAPTDMAHPPTATLMTETHFGSVSLSYLRNAAYRPRPIESYHVFNSTTTNSKLDYSASGFDGLLYSNTTSYNVSNQLMQPLSPWAVTGEGKWTTGWGNKTGKDRIFITSGKGQVFLP